MSYITDAFIGQTRIMIVGYNPASPATLLKTAYLIGRIKDELGEINECAFLEWLRSAPNGEAVVNDYLNGQLDKPSPPGIDPLNAEIELRIQSWLEGERRKGARPGYIEGLKR